MELDGLIKDSRLNPHAQRTGNRRILNRSTALADTSDLRLAVERNTILISTASSMPSNMVAYESVSADCRPILRQGFRTKTRQRSLIGLFPERTTSDCLLLPPFPGLKKW
uniref:Uncharacterized protein n=1 Tax=Timema cristinae TaxID=61476 RepID=A0A7R9CSK6_TIMCR|nr:unnamed protein product [Timema cristinae]